MTPPRPRARLDSAVSICAVVAVLLGVGFRFAALNAPLFWQDEEFTALRVTGHLKVDYLQLFDGGVHPVAQIRALESVDASRGVPAVVAALAREEPQHPPLYYALCRLWVGVFGTTPAGFRSFSAAIGSIGIGLAFLLGTTLLGSRVGGAVTASIFALSPIFVLYARQAREYALFAD
ncbi:MAG: glycosyltransferase family 39 protein, partial [Candidatus Eremiobacteraeota bacterium]|nr:glycosyltransferase family 39 protein [Candidatus Eremiobacteraeota bacterium]